MARNSAANSGFGKKADAPCAKKRSTTARKHMYIIYKPEAKEAGMNYRTYACCITHAISRFIANMEHN